MGCPVSKNVSRSLQRKNDEDDCNYNVEYDEEGEHVSKYDRNIIDHIRKDLRDNPELFVLNNVLMSTLFLDNFQTEIREVIQKRHLNGESTIEPDILLEKANKNVIYRPLHGPKKDAPEPLVTKRIYFPLNDSIEVYQSIDVPDQLGRRTKCQVKIEDSRRRGYVKLRELTSSIPPDNNSQIEYLSIPSSNLRIPKPIQDDNGNVDNQSLNDCFVYRKVKKADIDLDMEDLDAEELTDEDVYDVVSYLTSRGFMKYFQSTLFINSTERALCFDNCQVTDAKSIPGKIFCNLTDNEETYPCEIMPCLTISWPEGQTLDFLWRENTERKSLWPTEKMLNEMRCLNCALVPKSYARKRGFYPDADLEWEIHFPLAERYLDSYMSMPQLKCLLVLMTLHKEYIEPITKQQGLLPEHLKTHMYWQCEKNYNEWPEHRLGVKLLNIIQSLSNALHKRTFPDYFVKKKNLFQNIQRKYLEPANEAFHAIIQSPLTFVIRALRNLRNKSGKFYPPLDYKELIRILTSSAWDLENGTGELDTVSVQKKPRFTDAEKQLQYVKEMQRKRKILEKRKAKEAGKQNITNLKYHYSFAARRESHDSIDDDWKCEKQFDIHKKMALLKLFITNYINLAKTCTRISTVRQSMFYLKQAWYLTKIFEEECAIFRDEVQEFYKKIKKEEANCFEEKPVSEALNLTAQPQIVINDRQTSEKDDIINYHSLNRSYNSAARNSR
ncbi:uncharacterized protein LOC132703455 isoform X2 [Cylas formicarius]|uniref:uncharacterized protein LOC132703455 isoform X2 n=1 Tax=Cylas formicarius TaxID=197179 RepID=UPI0029589405|nr:uncharacterized protein LOC132703455 isoform X2 [Cylas formicarius]